MPDAAEQPEIVIKLMQAICLLECGDVTLPTGDIQADVTPELLGRIADQVLEAARFVSRQRGDLREQVHLYRIESAALRRSLADRSANG